MTSDQASFLARSSSFVTMLENVHHTLTNSIIAKLYCWPIQATAQSAEFLVPKASIATRAKGGNRSVSRIPQDAPTPSIHRSRKTTIPDTPMGGTHPRITVDPGGGAGFNRWLRTAISSTPPDHVPKK
jgi:hypothetical protein